MALETVNQYVDEARTLLQDKSEVYRYTTAELVSALNMGILTARRMRPDLFINVASLPSFTAADVTASTTFNMDEQYRAAFLYFMVGWAQLRDEEDTQDTRAAAFIGKFSQQLTVMA